MFASTSAVQYDGAAELMLASPVSMPTFSGPKRRTAKNFSETSAFTGEV